MSVSPHTGTGATMKNSSATQDTFVGDARGLPRRAASAATQPSLQISIGVNSVPGLSARSFVPIRFCTGFSATASESDLSQLVLLILTAKSDLLMKIAT